jgi:hypothetical protein
MTDDGGVLGNLPRSRPGRRSEKRASAGAEQPGAAAKRPSSRSGAARKGPSPRRPAEASRTPAPSRSADPVGGVIRGAAKAAGTGVRVAGAVAQEVLRRVPRP